MKTRRNFAYTFALLVSVFAPCLLSSCFSNMLADYERNSKRRVKESLFQIREVNRFISTDPGTFEIEMIAELPSGDLATVSAPIRISEGNLSHHNDVVAARDSTPVITKHSVSSDLKAQRITAIPPGLLPLFNPDILLNMSHSDIQVNGPLDIFGKGEGCIRSISRSPPDKSYTIEYCSGRIAKLTFFSDSGPYLSCCRYRTEPSPGTLPVNYEQHEMDRGVLVHVHDSPFPLTFVHLPLNVTLPAGARIVYLPIRTYHYAQKTPNTILINSLKPVAVVADIITLPVLIPVAASIYLFMFYSGD